MKQLLSILLLCSAAVCTAGLKGSTQHYAGSSPAGPPLVARIELANGVNTTIATGCRLPQLIAVNRWVAAPALTVRGEALAGLTASPRTR